MKASEPAELSDALAACGLDPQLALLETVHATSGEVHFLVSRDMSQRFACKVYSSHAFAPGLNELDFYRRFSTRISNAIPAFFGGWVEADARICAVVTADLRASHLRSDSATLEQELPHVARQLARLHASYWESECLWSGELAVVQEGSLSVMQALPFDAALDECRRLLEESVPLFCAKFASVLPAHWPGLLEKLPASWPVLYGERVSSRKRLTMLHGDANKHNIFLPRSDQDGVCFIDWEAFKCGVGAFDLGYMLITSVAPRRRRDLEGPAAEEYWRAFAASCSNAGTFENFITDYRLGIVGVVLVALRWGRLQAVHDAMRAFEDWRCTELLS